MSEPTKNPFQAMQEEALEQTGPEDEVLNRAQSAIDQLLQSLDKAESAQDVVIILIRLSTFGVGIGILLKAVEERFEFIASQTVEPTYKELVSRAGANVTFARRNGHAPEAGDLDAVGAPMIDQALITRVRDAIAKHGESFGIGSGMIKGLSDQAEIAIRAD